MKRRVLSSSIQRVTFAACNNYSRLYHASAIQAQKSIVFFDAKKHDKIFFSELNSKRSSPYKLVFHGEKLSPTTVTMAQGNDAVCTFVNDDVSATVVKELAKSGINLILLRCAGFNNVSIPTCKAENITVARVPAYSPHAIAEYAAGLMLALNRKLHRSYHRTIEGNFALDGLLGFDMYGKTVGVVGTGKIGLELIKILASGFSCKVKCLDKVTNPEVLNIPNTEYVQQFNDIARTCDIISLHLPLNDATRHIINEDSIQQMKNGVMLINTGRGGLIDTSALIKGLSSGKIGSAGLDVIENEAGYFFEDHSADVTIDQNISRLLTFKNVIISPHQAFFTTEAMNGISGTTLTNADLYFLSNKKGKEHPNNVWD